MTRQEQKQYRALGMKRALDLLRSRSIKVDADNTSLIEEMRRYKWSDSHAAQECQDSGKPCRHECSGLCRNRC